MSETTVARTTHSSDTDNARSSTSDATGCRSECALPPTRHDIDAFMITYAAHLPHPVVGVEASAAGKVQVALRSTPRLLAPYLYTGADYALVLAACFPTRCVDLALLNWSSSPLLSQRQGNLRVFCQAARALALPDAPLSALHPELLQGNPACVVAHLKVQHWLYSLSLRFPPMADHDAATLRAVHRHLQLGEPYLKRGRTESAGQGQETCPAVRECGPLSAMDLVHCCGPVLAPLPPFTVAPEATAQATAPSSSSAGSAAHSTANEDAGSAASAEGHSGHLRQGEGASRSARQKPWLNYSKPWLLPSLRAAEAKKAASEAAAAKREQEERERNPRYTAFAALSKDVQQQYVLSKTAAAEKRMQLRAVKALLMQEIVEGRTPDYKDIAERLREHC